MKKNTEFARAIKSRNWETLDWEGHMDLLQWPKSEDLHRQFDDRDKGLLLELAEAEDVPPMGRAFGVRLLAHIRAPEVLALFQRKYREAEQAGDYRTITEFLVWRLTDYDQLTEEEHRKLYNAVSGEPAFAHFKQQFIFFCGGDPRQVLDAVRQRLGDPRFPASKHWLYLCGALAAPAEQGQELRELLSVYQGCADFTGAVAKQLLTKSEV